MKLGLNLGLLGRGFDPDGAGPVAPPLTPEAPSVAAQGAISGRSVQISLTALTGVPLPSASLTSLTLDGVDVLSAATGLGPWYYAVPDGLSAQDVAWTVTALSSAGTDTASGFETIAANQSLPLVSASDSLSGRDLTITVDAVTGDPAPSAALTSLTLDGVDVLGDASGSGPWTYTVPDAEGDQVLAWTVTATSAVGADTASGSATVAGNVAPPATSFTPADITGIVDYVESWNAPSGTFVGAPSTLGVLQTLNANTNTADVPGGNQVGLPALNVDNRLRYHSNISPLNINHAEGVTFFYAGRMVAAQNSVAGDEPQILRLGGSNGIQVTSQPLTTDSGPITVRAQPNSGSMLVDYEPSSDITGQDVSIVIRYKKGGDLEIWVNGVKSTDPAQIGGGPTADLVFSEIELSAFNSFSRVNQYVYTFAIAKGVVSDAEIDQWLDWLEDETGLTHTDLGTSPAFDPEAGLTVTNTFAQNTSFFVANGYESAVFAFEVDSFTDFGKIMLPRFTNSFGVGIDADGRVFAGIYDESLVVSDPGFTTGTVVIAIDRDADTLTLWVNGTQYDGVGSIDRFNRWSNSGNFEYVWAGNTARTISGQNFPGFATSDVNWPNDQTAQGTFSDLRYYEDQTVNTQPEPAFDPEAGLTGAVTYAPDDTVIDGTNFSIEEPTVWAFTVPTDWSDGGIVLNIGGLWGACVVIADDGRIGVFSRDATAPASFNYVLSDVGAVSPGDRVVVQFLVPSVGRQRMWVEGNEITYATVEDNTYSIWAGGAEGSYLETTDSDGQRGGSTAFPVGDSWPSMPDNRIDDGTWGDLTLYANQTIITP